MEVRCHHCGHVTPVTGDPFGGREKVDLTCPACGLTNRIVNPQLATFRVDTTKKKVSPLAAEVGADGRPLRLPEDQEISLKALEGEEKGTVYPVLKPRITLGRANCDITVIDPLISRTHCVLEIGDDGVLLRDLGSTNGTLMSGQRIETAWLSSGSIFRIGRHLLQLTIVPKKT